MMNICVEYLREGVQYKLNFHAKEYFSRIFAMNISAEYLWSL